MNYNDAQLLECAAKAAGIETHGWRATEPSGYFVLPEKETGAYTLWNPLTDDGDALRLAVKLQMTVSTCEWGMNTVAVIAQHAHCAEPHNIDSYAATRRAIVRAAAEIGRAS